MATIDVSWARKAEGRGVCASVRDEIELIILGTMVSTHIFRARDCVRCVGISKKNAITRGLKTALIFDGDYKR